MIRGLGRTRSSWRGLWGVVKHAESTSPQQGGPSDSVRWPYSQFSPFVDSPAKSMNLLKAFTFYYANPHPEVSPHLFLTTTLFNEIGAIGLLSHQMRHYPHRILQWTDHLLEALPSFVESELSVIDPQSKQRLQQTHGDPKRYLIDRRTDLLASVLYSVKDCSSACQAAAKESFESIDFSPESVSKRETESVF